MIIMHNDDFTFGDLPLSTTARAQLTGIHETMKSASVATEKLRLLRLLAGSGYDRQRGLYIPLSSRVDVRGKLPDESAENTEAIVPFPFSFFSNGLVIPPGHGTAEFDAAAVLSPIARVTNPGFLIVTLEVDCETIDHLEQNLAWTRDRGRNSGVIRKVDESLCRYSDYRGHSCVFSGNRSVHFHFFFSTQHLERASSTASAAERIEPGHKAAAAIMAKCHEIYWDRVAEHFVDAAQTAVKFDIRLQSVVQWRRAPWGVREITTEDLKKNVLGFSLGDHVPQLVLRENIRSRAPRRQEDFLVPPNFDAPQPRRSSSQRTRFGNTEELVGDDVLVEVQRLCAEEWGEYPKPTALQHGPDGWIIRFQNSATDRNPSTIVKGHHRRLLLNGSHEFNNEFFLPDGMSADEIVEHARWICGETLHVSDGKREAAFTSGKSEKPRTQNPIAGMMERSFARPVPPGSSQLDHLRERLRDVLALIRTLVDRPIRVGIGSSQKGRWQAVLIKSVEGIGKTRSMFGLMADQILDDAMAREDWAVKAGKEPSSVGERFCVFAFRSHEQARSKAEEFRREGRCGSVVIKSFWRHYEDACKEAGEKPISRSALKTFEGGPVLAVILHQPAVFAKLEEARATLWSTDGKYNSGTTILFTTHAQVKTWETARDTPIWHHPDYDPNVPIKDQEHLARAFSIGKVIFDEPEIDDILSRCDESAYDLLKASQAHHPNWKRMPRWEREEAFREISTGFSLSDSSFEEFDEWMRCDLSKLERIQVDVLRIPLWTNAGDADIYRRTHGRVMYIGVRDWIISNLQLNFLTTEELISDVISFAYGKLAQDRQVQRFDLDVEDGMFPIEIPMLLDRRASRRRVSEIVSDISRSEPASRIIVDGCEDDRVTNFTRMKGSNGFRDDDLYVIPLFPNPDQYADLNALGLYIGKDDVIETYYQDQINQACGRNRGFRDSAAGKTKTVVIASRRLYNTVLNRIRGGRFLFRLVKHPPWLDAAHREADAPPPLDRISSLLIRKPVKVWVLNGGECGQIQPDLTRRS